jgi:hypothetical protein
VCSGGPCRKVTSGKIYLTAGPVQFSLVCKETVFLNSYEVSDWSESFLESITFLELAENCCG